MGKTLKGFILDGWSIGNPKDNEEAYQKMIDEGKIIAYKMIPISLARQEDLEKLKKFGINFINNYSHAIYIKK